MANPPVQTWTKYNFYLNYKLRNLNRARNFKSRQPFLYSVVIITMATAEQYFANLHRGIVLLTVIWFLSKVRTLSVHLTWIPQRSLFITIIIPLWIHFFGDSIGSDESDFVIEFYMIKVCMKDRVIMGMTNHDPISNTFVADSKELLPARSKIMTCKCLSSASGVTSTSGDRSICSVWFIST